MSEGSIPPFQAATESPAADSAPLTRRVARGGLWIMGSRFSGRLFDLVKALVLARLLTPADFGLFGVVMLTLAALDIFSQTGLNAALITRQGDIRPHLSTAWTVQILRGVALCGVLYLSAPLVALFFKEPQVTALLRFMGLALLVQGFINTGIVFFDRDLAFHRSFVYEVGSGGLSLVAGILLAYLLRSAWALVWANLIGACARVVLSFVLADTRPRLEFVKSRAAELLAFGKWMSGYAIVSFVWQNIDRIVLGRLLGAAALGIYQMAQRVASMPVSQVATASIGVTLPAYAQMQHEPERLGRTFLDVFETVMAIVAPLTVFVSVAAPEVVHGLLGGKWVEMIDPLRILAVGALFTALDITSTPLFIGTGRPRLEFWKNLIRSVVVVASIFPLTARFGLTGACISFVLGSLAPCLFWGFAMKIAHIRWRDLAISTALVGLMAAAIPPAILATRALIGESGALSLIIAATGCVLSWGVVGYALGALTRRGIFMHIGRLRTAGFSS